ncbi:MAG: 3'-5' exonuclease [Candidatus Eiseniibacteriota bacterium]
MNENLLGRLRITRPLVFLDLETTGLDPRVDRIVEISIMKVFPEGPDGETREPEVRTKRVHPGIPIPPGATAIHGITDADVALEPPFAAYARSLFEQFEGCDFAGFGVRRYDLPLLQAEFKRAGFTFELAGRHCVDGKEIFHAKEPRTLSAAYALYCGGELKSAHSAQADMLAARDVILAQLEHYDDLPGEIESLGKVGAPGSDPDAYDADGKLKWIGDDVVINFGKSRGRSLKDLSRDEDGRGLLTWILRHDFGEEVKRAARNALEGRYPVREREAAGPGAGREVEREAGGEVGGEAERVTRSSTNTAIENASAG